MLSPLRAALWLHPTWWLHLSTWNYSVLLVGALDCYLLLRLDKSCSPLPTLRCLLAGTEKRVVPSSLSPCSAEERLELVPKAACCLLESLYICVVFTGVWPHSCEQLNRNWPVLISALDCCDVKDREGHLNFFRFIPQFAGNSMELSCGISWCPHMAWNCFLLTSCDWKN